MCFKREKIDLSGFWDGELKLNSGIDVAVPDVIRKDFHVPLSWNMQIKDLQWPSDSQEISAITRPIQNQNFRDKERKFSEGVIIYRKNVQIMKKTGTREYLVFEGANHRTSVLINGKKAGENRNGHLKFEFDITELTTDGENTLEITVDNHRDRNTCPQEQFNWKNYGGIYRPVYIEIRPESHIADYTVLPGRENGRWFADVNVTHTGKPDMKVIINISSGKERKSAEITTDATGSSSARIYMDSPVIWQPGKGGMSEIKISLSGKETDSISGRFGFRTVEIKGRDVLVNGEKFYIRGASFHEQHPAFGNSVPAWQWVSDIKLLKNCGLNAIRAAHYPYAQGFYEACDSEGIVCIAEMPCWQFNEYHFKNAEVLEHCVSYAGKIVSQLCNHPSIIGWSIQNESKTFESGAAEFFSKINNVFKSKDPTRFTMTAENPEPPEHLAVIKKVKGAPKGKTPPTADIADTFGINDYSGWYGEKSSYLPLLLDHVTSQLTGKPVFVSEFGAEATHGIRSLMMTFYSEDLQAELLCRHIEEILKRDSISGFFIWLFFDYEGSSISIAGINAKGIVDSYRNPKLAYNMIKNIFEGKNQ